MACFWRLVTISHFENGYLNPVNFGETVLLTTCRSVHLDNGWGTVDSLNHDNNDGFDRGIYCRKFRNDLGAITHVKYEPRLKRDNQSLWLGQFDTKSEAKLVRDVAIFFYGNDASGWLDLEEGCFCAVQPNPDQDGRRYYLIPQLTERREGKEKAKLVCRAAKQVHKDFEKKETEYKEFKKETEELANWLETIMRGTEEYEVPRRSGVVNGVVNGDGDSNGHSDTGPLQQPDSQDEIMQDNRGMTSNISSATNPLVFSDGHEVFEGAMENIPALRSEDALRLDPPGSDAINYELGQTVAQVPLINCTSAISDPVSTLAVMWKTTFYKLSVSLCKRINSFYNLSILFRRRIKS